MTQSKIIFLCFSDSVGDFNRGGSFRDPGRSGGCAADCCGGSCVESECYQLFDNLIDNVLK